MKVIEGVRRVPQIVTRNIDNAGTPIPSAFDWQDFVTKEAPRLYRYFLSRFEHSVASDLVQETLLRLVIKVDNGTFDPARGAVMAYAFGLAHFVAREAARTSSRKREFTASDHATWNSIADESQTPEETLTRHGSIEALRSAIASLPQAEIISLLIDKDLSLSEISAITEIPLNTIKSHVHRAKARLRVALAQPRPNDFAKQQGDIYE
jgi:RNA polymerase sigma-70 factor (ECF subfamily)